MNGWSSGSYSATAALYLLSSVAWLSLLLLRLLQLRRLLASSCANENFFDQGPPPRIIGWFQQPSHQPLKQKATSHVRLLSRQFTISMIAVQSISFQDRFSTVIKLSAKYSVKGLNHNNSGPSFSHDPVPPSVFANLPHNSIMAMRPNSSKNHRPKAFLKASGMCYSGGWLMALFPYNSATLWAY